jgi:hypothetical protein
MLRPAAVWIVVLLIASPASAEDYFQIQIVDEATERGVPLVEVTTVHGIRQWTDSAGIVAFHEPGLMGRDVFFSIKSHGYEFPEDRFGFRGKRLKTVVGGSAVLKIRRLNIAERLYRVTGGGIYRDSLLVGQSTPLREPALNGQVLGSDSVQTAVFRNQLYWFWGDTNRPSYPLGNFKVSGATSLLPINGGLDPATGVDLNYFVDESGFAKKTIPWKGTGPTWISGLVTIGQGENERLFAHYQDIQGGGTSFEATSQGFVEFDDATKEFCKVREFPQEGPFPEGAHSLLFKEGGETYVYFCNPFPLVRVNATPDALADLSQYEAFTCLKDGTRRDDNQVDRDADGRVRWSWKKNTGVVGPRQQEPLVKRGVLDREDAVLTLRDVETGDVVVAHRGTVAYNAFRKRWIMIFCQVFGTSPLGEIWYAEADALTGPWNEARKIVSHDRYSFYNPRHHPMLDAEDGRIIYFEGTYTATFSGNADKTPRYDYNQLMYRLDLGDERLGKMGHRQ